MKRLATFISTIAIDTSSHNMPACFLASFDVSVNYKASTNCGVTR